MDEKMFQIKAKILENKKISQDHYKLTFSSEEIAKSAKPGQFLEIRIEGVFLRRPFSIHRVRNKKIEIIYRIRGKGTENLSKYKFGEYLDIIGPLGNGFNLDFSFLSHSILVGGGYGVSPLYFLAEKIIKNSDKKDKIFVFIGAKKKNYIICEDEFKKLGCKVYISTEDGSKGYRGVITELLISQLSLLPSHLLTFYCCGPSPMLKEVAKIAKIKKIKCYVSLETTMGCGFGVCLGCAIKTKSGYKLVCKDGPVFDAEEIFWDEL
jgi:dihydroorotate dehydrogenase electron transfer subunit